MLAWERGYKMARIRIVALGAICLLLTVAVLIVLQTYVSSRKSPNAWRVKYQAAGFRVPIERLNCSDRMCTQFVTDRDSPYWMYCLRKARRDLNETERSACHFIDGVGRHPVALASFPGSGNTWVRGLLQQITGVCTGAIYCDITLRQRGFPGESIRSGITLVVKTHQTDPRWSGVTYSQSEPFKYFKTLRDVPVYSAAILIVRNPYDALVAEWHRKQTDSLPDNHIDQVGMEYFRENTAWDAYIHSQAVEWQDTIVGWLLKNKQHPVMVVKFEDLKRNTATELIRILDFLRVPYTREKVLGVVTAGFDEFRRRRHMPSLEYFTLKQVEHVGDVLRTTSSLLDAKKLTNVCNILSYLTVKD